MILDVLFLLFAGTGFWLGYTKGMALAVFSVVGYLTAFFLTLWISPWVMQGMVKWLHAGKMFALVFGTLFTLVGFILLVRWILKSVDAYLKTSKLTSLSKIGGGLVMSMTGILFYGFVLWLVLQTGWIKKSTEEASHTYSFVSGIPLKTGNFVGEFKPLFRQYWELTEQTIAESRSDPDPH